MKYKVFPNISHINAWVRRTETWLVVFSIILPTYTKIMAKPTHLLTPRSYWLHTDVCGKKMWLQFGGQTEQAILATDNQKYMKDINWNFIIIFRVQKILSCTSRMKLKLKLWWHFNLFAGYNITGVQGKFLFNCTTEYIKNKIIWICWLLNSVAIICDWYFGTILRLQATTHLMLMRITTSDTFVGKWLKIKLLKM